MMSKQEGSSSLMELRFSKLEGTNHRIWMMRVTDLLQREGLRQLTGEEVILEKPESLSVHYEKNLDRYQAQQRRILKAMGTLHGYYRRNHCGVLQLSMEDAEADLGASIESV